MSDWDQFGSAYDFPEFDGTPKTYLLASTPRSGSHWLGHLLFQTGVMGSPLEYFHPGHLATWKKKFGVKTVRKLMPLLYRRRTTPNGWFGVKAHWPQFEPIAKRPVVLQTINFERYIWIVRRDVVAQAISLVIARQTSAWISFHQPKGEPRYSFRAIRKALKQLQAQNEDWDRFFKANNIEPLVIEYEVGVADPKAVVNRVCSYFGIDSVSEGMAPDIRPQRQSDKTNLIWKERYLSDLQKKQETL